MAKNIDEMLGKIEEKIDDVSSTIYKIDKEIALEKAAFDEHIKQDEKMYEEFKRMNDILQQNTESLKEHMHRTELLEQIVQRIDARLTPLEVERIEKEAVEKYTREKLMKYGKVLGVVATMIGIFAAMKPLLLKLLSL